MRADLSSGRAAMTTDEARDILGVQADASIEEIRAAYRRAARQHHPDANGNRAEESTRRFILAARAYEVLLRAGRPVDQAVRLTPADEAGLAFARQLATGRRPVVRQGRDWGPLSAARCDRRRSLHWVFDVLAISLLTGILLFYSAGQAGLTGPGESYGESDGQGVSQGSEGKVRPANRWEPEEVFSVLGWLIVILWVVARVAIAAHDRDVTGKKSRRTARR